MDLNISLLSAVDFTPRLIHWFLAHYLISINVFMCFQFLLLLYSLLAGCSPLIGCHDVFQWLQIFFDSMDTASCWVDRLSQSVCCAGSSLSDSAPGLRSSTPPPSSLAHCEHAMAQWGGSKQQQGCRWTLWCSGHASTAGMGGGDFSFAISLWYISSFLCCFCTTLSWSFAFQKWL